MSQNPHIRPRAAQKRKRPGTSADSDRERSNSAPSRRNPPRRAVHRRIVVEKVYCNFCGDHLGDKINKCQDCGAYMCEQSEENGSGCILVGTVGEQEPFRCIVCEPRNWKKLKNPPEGEAGCFAYGFTGYGGRKRSKLTWPLVVAYLSPSSLPDKYVQEALHLDLSHHFRLCEENVSTGLPYRVLHLTHRRSYAQLLRFCSRTAKGRRIRRWQQPSISSSVQSRPPFLQTRSSS
ncbi:hypothetical protein EV363DRAFT_1178081 [Boletus edulis]|nr:hypothetical protein EV363DRAFT_1178081 [Boletus edulis]